MRHNLGIVYDRTSYLPELLEVFNHDTKTVFLDNVYLHSLDGLPEQVSEESYLPIQMMVLLHTRGGRRMSQLVAFSG